MKSKPSILVLGAGIQGICVALALRKRGYRVTVIEQMPDLMLRASLRNEGKIHLGFVYANDASFQTSALMLRAALQFAPLFEAWLETPVDWGALCSTPFVYLVMRDSMLASEKIHAHYERLQNCLQEMIDAGEAANYLGNDLRDKKLWKRSDSATAQWFAPAHVGEFIDTVEVALNCEQFRKRIRAALARMPEIELRYGHRIEHIERSAEGFCVQGTRADGTGWHRSADLVINCLWEGRLALDEQLGITPRRAFVMRLKYRLLVEPCAGLKNLPSLTMVLGRYGDVVQHTRGLTYLSWYPACLRGWSSGIIPPREWDDVCAGKPPKEIARQVARETLNAFDEIVPGLGASRVHTVDGGVIYSWGETDIDDHTSKLHTRHEIGYTEHDGYYSVDTGKFTCAPMFAEQLVRELDE